MPYFLQVPVVAQPTNAVCWHASALMIWYYWQGVSGRQGPMNTNDKKFAANQTTTPNEWVQLAHTVGMEPLTLKPAAYTGKVLERLLVENGPLWCAGRWYGRGHVIVLTGVNNNTIFFNDPGNGGQRKMNTAAWFDSKVYRNVYGAIMYKNPLAY